MEQLIEGGEYTIAVLDGQALASIHIVPAGEYYDYHAKYVADDTQYMCPGLDEGERSRSARAGSSARSPDSTSGAGARVDFMRDRDGRNWLLEVNTAPGMTSHSLMPKAARRVRHRFRGIVLADPRASIPEAS